MADIYVNFPTMPTGYIRGDIDFELGELIKGRGSVSGGGAGLKDSRFHVDLELDTEDPNQVEEFITILLNYLRALPAPEGTELVVVIGDPEDGERRPVY